MTAFVSIEIEKHSGKKKTLAQKFGACKFLVLVMGTLKVNICLNLDYLRFHGNYNSVYGGQSGDAYLALTGGCSEYIDFDKEFDKDKDGSKARFLHARLKNAVKSGSLVCTEVPVSIFIGR